MRGVDEHLVDAVDVNVLRRHVLEIDAVDLRGDLFVQRHLRRRDHIGDLAVMLRLIQPDGLLRLEQPWSGSHAHGLQRRADRQADGLVGPALIRHQQVECQRVLVPLDTFDAGVVALEVDGDIHVGSQSLASFPLTTSSSSPRSNSSG